MFERLAGNFRIVLNGSLFVAVVECVTSEITGKCRGNWAKYRHSICITLSHG